MLAFQIYHPKNIIIYLYLLLYLNYFIQWLNIIYFNLVLKLNIQIYIPRYLLPFLSN